MSVIYELAGQMTLQSSLLHNGGETYGISSKLRREKFVQPDGSVEDVPVVSGNSIRGRLRDLGMAHCCRALGYGVSEDGGSVRGLSLPAFYFLFSGGALTASDGGKALDLAYARTLRELIPLVGLFGGAVGNQILPGKLTVGKAYPICRETQHLLPAPYQRDQPVSIWAYVQEEMYTRKDDEKDEHKRALLDGHTQQLLLAGASKQGLTDAGPQQMRYYVETFAAGTPFYWSIDVTDPTDLEFEALLACLAEFSKQPFLGGRSAAGHGRVSLTLDRWLRIDSRAATESTAVDRPLGTKYHQHLAQRSDEIRALLAEMH